MGQAQAVRETLGPITDSACNISVKKGDKDFSAAVTQIMGQKPDAVVYASYYSEAALLVQQLHDAGYTGIFAAPTASRTRSSSRQQALPRRAPSCRARAVGNRQLRRGIQQEVRTEPGTYSLEAYDLATILLKGIDSGAVTRQALLDFVTNYDGQGIARKYQWTPPVNSPRI